MHHLGLLDFFIFVIVPSDGNSSSWAVGRRPLYAQLEVLRTAGDLNSPSHVVSAWRPRFGPKLQALVLRHPSFLEEGAGKRCSECGSALVLDQRHRYHAALGYSTVSGANSKPRVQ